MVSGEPGAQSVSGFRMDLVCLEKMMDTKQTAAYDPAIFCDSRVLDNLLHLESAYVPKNYFGESQPDLRSFMRRIITTWMLEMCEEQNCEEQVFPLAINFFDRFLASCEIKSNQLQLTAVTSLLLASKVRMSVPLTVNLLSYYTDHSVLPDQIKAWEMLMLSKLGWEVCGVTGFDFIDHLLHHLQISSEVIRTHTVTLVDLAYTDAELIGVKPSVITSAALVAALRGLKQPDILSEVCEVCKCDPESVESVVIRIERTLAEEAQHHPRPRSSAKTA